MVELRNASIIDDIRILEVAREDAKYILRNRDNEDFKDIIKSAEDSYNSSGLSID
jgi:RecG-like helicase